MTAPVTTVFEPDWPDVPAARAICLVDASSGFERRLLESWIERHRPADTTVSTALLPPSRRRRFGAIDPGLAALLGGDDDPLLVPVRVAWLPEERNGRRSASVVDALKLGDPRDPDPLRQRWLYARYPDRCRIVVAEPARSSGVRARWEQSPEMLGFDEYVSRRAWLALERAERRLRGNRYKVPRFVHHEVSERPEFRVGVAHLARELGRPEAATRQRAVRYLREIAASHSTFLIDVIANAIHWIYRQGYGALSYDEQQVRDLYGLGQGHPLVFLPSHRSNLDRLVLQYLLWENDLPPNHTAGGINMNFFPVGPLIRRTGVFFIRRSFKDNPLYKLVLRSYIDYLIEKRFSLEFYLEGGRSRSGKLLPPRYGLLAYVTDAYRRGKSDDVFLIPTSIAYDHIQDVGAYASEQRGDTKERESFSWAWRAIRSLRRRYGNIYVRFGEPVSLAKEMPVGDEGEMDVPKLAFEVMARIGRVTPITPTSLVTLALLAREDRAMTVPEIIDELSDLIAFVERRRFPTTEPLRLDDGSIRAVLDRLAEHDLVTTFDAGPEAVYAIRAEQHLAAAFYRNTIVHFFVTGAIAELALAAAAEVSEEVDPRDAFWEEVMRLRDLLKFEFFFSGKDAFREEVRQELDEQSPGWEERLASGPDGARSVLHQQRPLRAHWALRAFLEAYRVVGDELARRPPDQAIDRKPFIQACLALGKQYRLQRRIAAEESVSQVLFGSALSLAENRDLLATDRPDSAVRRQQFAAEISAVLRRLDTVAALAEGRRRGVV